MVVIRAVIAFLGEFTPYVCHAIPAIFNFQKHLSCLSFRSKSDLDQIPDLKVPLLIFSCFLVHWFESIVCACWNGTWFRSLLKLSDSRRERTQSHLESAQWPTELLSPSHQAVQNNTSWNWHLWILIKRAIDKRREEVLRVRAENRAMGPVKGLQGRGWKDERHQLTLMNKKLWLNFSGSNTFVPCQTEGFTTLCDDWHRKTSIKV